MKEFYLLLLFCITLLGANSQPGRLDLTFGKKGIQEAAFPNNLNILNEFGSAVLTSANGDLYVAVNAYNFTRIVKYLPDGRLDFSYGNAGRSNAAYFNSTSVVLQGEKIIVGGYTYVTGNSSENFALARYTAKGKLDSSFGKNGMTITDINGSNDEAFSIALQGDKIIMGGPLKTHLLAEVILRLPAILRMEFWTLRSE